MWSGHSCPLPKTGLLACGADTPVRCPKQDCWHVERTLLSAAQNRTGDEGCPIQARLWLEWGSYAAYATHMPWSLKRFQNTGQTHFVTFSCYQRRPMLTTDPSRRLFESALERVRINFRIRVYAYVVMPEHIHLLVSEPQRGTLADALKSLKQSVARRLLAGAEHFWQKHYYDFNIRSHPQFLEKIRYIHRNPVKRGLCVRPEDWQWSSFRHYATGCEGRVEIESEWTARKRARAGGEIATSHRTTPLKLRRLCGVRAARRNPERVEGPTLPGLEWGTLTRRV
jgi:putative transposase